jgi:hypothetical protein
LPAIEIRPRRATEIVDTGFQLLRRYYPQLFTITAIAMAPSVFARVMMRGTLSDPTALAAHPGEVGGAFLIITLCTMLADAVLIVAASDGYLEGNVDLARALRSGAANLFTLIVTVFVRSAVLMGVLLVAVLVGALFTAVHLQALAILGVFLAMGFVFYVMFRTFAAYNAVLLEGAGPIQAVMRSWRLAEGWGAHVFFTLMLVWILYLVIYFVVAGVAYAMFSRSAVEIFGAVAIVAIYPLISVVYTLLYYDLRVRKEGFDLEVMSRDLGDASSASPLPAA